MNKKQNSQVVLLTRGQEEERKRSEFGIQPSIHEIARKLVDKALSYHGGAF